MKRILQALAVGMLAVTGTFLITASPPPAGAWLNQWNYTNTEYCANIHPDTTCEIWFQTYEGWSDLTFCYRLPGEPKSYCLTPLPILCSGQRVCWFQEIGEGYYAIPDRWEIHSSTLNRIISVVPDGGP